MSIEQTLQLRGKHDSCSVARLATGRISLGSVVLGPDEVDDFCASVKEAVARLPKAPETTPKFDLTNDNPPM